MVLELRGLIIRGVCHRVSIPVRDLVVLEREPGFNNYAEMVSFNPCEGFGGFGTSIDQAISPFAQRFQSL